MKHQPKQCCTIPYLTFIKQSLLLTNQHQDLLAFVTQVNSLRKQQENAHEMGAMILDQMDVHYH